MGLHCHCSALRAPLAALRHVRVISEGHHDTAGAKRLQHADRDRVPERGREKGGGRERERDRAQHATIFPSLTPRASEGQLALEKSAVHCPALRSCAAAPCVRRTAVQYAAQTRGGSPRERTLSRQQSTAKLAKAEVLFRGSTVRSRSPSPWRLFASSQQQAVCGAAVIRPMNSLLS
jgi:hypothetical protein